MTITWTTPAMTASKPKFVKLLRCSQSSVASFSNHPHKLTNKLGRCHLTYVLHFLVMPTSCMSYWFLIFFFLICKISVYSLSPNPVYTPFCYRNSKMLQQCCDCCFPNHQAHHPFTPLSAIHKLCKCCYLASCCSSTVSYWGEICYKFQLNFLRNLPRTSSTCWDIA
jgi:hypothetical protein